MFARIENGKVMEVVSTSPEGRFHPDIVAQFVVCEDRILPDWTYSEGKFYAPDTSPVVTLAEARGAKRAGINAGFEAAITASLTMPSASYPASAFAIYQAIDEWKSDDPEGYASLLAIHSARRDELLAAVESADTAESVQAIVVSYAV